MILLEFVIGTETMNQCNTHSLQHTHSHTHTTHPILIRLENPKVPKNFVQVTQWGAYALMNDEKTAYTCWNVNNDVCVYVQHSFLPSSFQHKPTTFIFFFWGRSEGERRSFLWNTARNMLLFVALYAPTIDTDTLTHTNRLIHIFLNAVYII